MLVNQTNHIVSYQQHRERDFNKTANLVTRMKTMGRKSESESQSRIFARNLTHRPCYCRKELK